MASEPEEPVERNVFLRRLRQARVRQFAAAVTSLVAAAIILLLTDVRQIGAFAFYSLVALLLANALISWLQYCRVIRPITELLTQLQDISATLEGGRLPSDFSLDEKSASVFSDLAASFTSVMRRIGERLRFAERRLEIQNATVRGFPFTMYRVSRTGKFLALIQDVYALMPVLQLEKRPEQVKDVWTDENLAVFRGAVEKAFEGTPYAWFDLRFTASGESDPRHLRGTVAKLDDLSALVVLGDLSAIDRIFEVAMGSSKDDAFAHHQTALMRFAASIAHDAKNVFAALGNIAEIDRASSDPRVREQIPVIEEAIRRGTNLMRELMNFSGQVRYTFTCVSASDFLQDVASNASLKAMCPPNIELLASIPRGLPYIDVDTEQIWKIPFNLIRNAVEAMGEDVRGIISLKAEAYEMTRERARDFRHAPELRYGPGVLITRSDDGPGITPALLDHLFDPYFSSKGEGRGLGLATVLSVVLAHGGAIRAISRVGRGTTFITWLPLSRNSPEEIAMMKKIASNGEILLVDDDAMILRTTGLLLKALHVAAHPASNEEDALCKFRALAPRLRAVLIDAHLGGMLSTGLIRKIRSERPDLRIILASGDREGEVRAQFKGVAFDAFLEKPYTVAELSAVLGLNEQHAPSAVSAT